MKTTEAAELIEAIAASIQQNPSQFHFEISVIGTQATVIGGGIGLSVQAQGGGPGSTTIGFQSTVDGSNIRIAQRAANEAIQRQMVTLVQALNDITAELRSATPKRKRIDELLNSLKQSWVPNVIASVVANIVTKVALG